MDVPKSRFRTVFSHRHVVLPVIHVKKMDQAYRNAKVAREAGADGIFVINHGFRDETLLQVQEVLADAFPDWFIGVNCLGLSAEQVFSVISPKVSGVWTDNAGIEERRVDQPEAEKVKTIHQARVPNCLYFGGVAFKYQREVRDLESACTIAAQYMDVVTTSGPGTGRSAEVSKIARMKSALGNTPLAIASGITPDNVAEFLPHADCFLVATGISQSFTELDPGLVRDLIERVREFDDSLKGDSVVPNK